MNQATVDRRARHQSPRQATHSSAAPHHSAAPSPAGGTKTTKPRQSTPLPDRLWNFQQVCTFYGVSERKGAQMRADGVLPEPIVLGPRALRWIPSECMAAASASLPRQTVLCEPAQLARARIERMKAAGRVEA